MFKLYKQFQNVELQLQGRCGRKRRPKQGNLCILLRECGYCSLCYEYASRYTHAVQRLCVFSTCFKSSRYLMKSDTYVKFKFKKMKLVHCKERQKTT